MAIILIKSRRLKAFLVSFAGVYNPSLFLISGSVMLYKLTDKDIHQGYLTEESMSSGLGHHVRVFSFAEFPYTDELVREQKLPLDKLEIRARAIYQALKERDFVDVSPDDQFDVRRPFSYLDAKAAAAEPFPTMRCNNVEFSFRGQPPWGRHFSMIRQHGFVEAHNHTSLYVIGNDPHIGRTENNIFPGILNEEIPVISCHFKRAAFSLLNHDDAHRFWASALRMSPELIDNVPSDKAHNLITSLHEKRHLHQITIVSPSRAANYYKELDADMAAIASLKDRGVGQETIEANLHARYIGMLFTAPDYWFAPALEKLQKGEPVENFFRVYDATMEIKFRLAESLSGQPFIAVDSTDYQQKINAWDQEKSDSGRLSRSSLYFDYLANEYDVHTGKTIGGNPARLYTDLRKLIERNLFTDSFTLQVAYGIVSSAYHFNPDLVTADLEPSRRRLEDRCRAHQKPTNT